MMPAWRLRRRQAIDDPHVADMLDRCQDIPWGRGLLEFYWSAKNMGREVRAYLGLIDRYYLLVYGLHRTDFWAHGEKGNRWLYERCREVEAEPDDCLDLWAREHYKSTIITFGGITQEVLRDPELTVGIFSFNKKEAKKPLRQIMREFEGNRDLYALYPDVLWENPERQAPKWSESEGIVVKRLTNPREATVEAHGLVDGMPTGSHFGLRDYDDVVTRESVTTPEMIKKVTEARELSDNLGKRGGREWNVGTRYHYGDTYGVYLGRGVLKPRLYPATHDGTLNGKPVLFSEAEWEDKKRKQPSQVAAQLLQNPLAGQDQMFQIAWALPYWCRPRTLNVYIMGDPSKGSPQRRSDRTAIAVIGVDALHNRYLLDGYRHRMTLAERWKALKFLYRRWSKMPGAVSVSVGWEQYGLATDKEYFEERMLEEKLAFAIEELNWTRDHTRSKEDRVERLVPDFRDGRWFLPAVAWNGNKVCTWKVAGDRIEYAPLEGMPRAWERMEARMEGFRNAAPIKRFDESRQVYDLTSALLEEMIFFPFGTHDDLVDAVSRLHDMDPTPPLIVDHDALEPAVFIDS